MHRKTALALALASAFALSTHAVYADEDKKDSPYPQVIADGEDKEAPKPELVADGEDKEAPKPELAA